MKHLLLLLLTAGIAMTTACSSNDTYDEQEDDASTAADMKPAAAEVKAAPAPQMPAEVEAEEESEPEIQPVEDPEPAATASSSNGSAVTYVCTHGDNVRTIKVIYHDEGPKACEVTYEKSTGTQTLWNANTDEAYCEDRAAEFVVKQEGWGWSCNKE